MSLQKPSTSAKKAGTKGDPDNVVPITTNLEKATSGGTVQLPLMVPPNLKRDFKVYAAERELTMSALFLVMWDEYKVRNP